MFSKTGENSIAEYWTAKQDSPGKTLTIRRAKIPGSGPVCLTCVSRNCKHVAMFNRWINQTPEPWETQEGLTILGPG